jgi:lactonase
VLSNLAVKPGTKQGYLTVGGRNGGFIYSFTALATGVPQSNGGS